MIKLFVALGMWIYLLAAGLMFLSITAQEDARHAHQGVGDRILLSILWPVDVALQCGERRGNLEADRQQKKLEQ